VYWIVIGQPDITIVYFSKLFYMAKQNVGSCSLQDAELELSREINEYKIHYSWRFLQLVGIMY
jgi:hypothetical protein